jgi:minor extracellular serine protease Vpr
MKKLLLGLGSLFCSFYLLNAQAEMSVSARIFQQKLSSFLSSDGTRLLEISPSFIESYDIYSKRGYFYVGVLALTDPDRLSEERLTEDGIIISSRVQHILSLRVPLEKFDKLTKVPGILYIESGGQLGGPYLDRSRFSTRADSVHQGLGGLEMTYRGKGVIVAVIDWGFDYTHPVFYDTTLQHLRISRAWDQNKKSGPAPEGFDFGTEYIGQQQLLAAREDTLYVFGPGSHGTHVGGIAGGGGAGSKYTGIAPESELVFISLLRDDASFVDAITYLTNYADKANKPLVVNMSFGSHTGPHDGSTLRSRAMDMLAGKGKIFVASAGNNGVENFHLLHRFPEDGDTLASMLSFNAGVEDYFGQCVNAWGQEGKSFSIGLEALNAANQVVFSTPFYATEDNLLLDDTVYINGSDTLILRLVSEKRNALNGAPNMLLEVKKTGGIKVKMKSVAPGGQVHYWQVIRLNARYTNWGSAFAGNLPGTRAGDTRYGIGGAPGVTKEVITVASHRGEIILPNGQVNLGQLSSFSSKGPTVDGRTKPEISGPGQDVASSVNSFDPNPGTSVLTTEFNGKTYSFVRYSGTSMSGPAVTGVVALMLEANPELYARDVKEILKATARLDQHTGPIGPEGDLSWGWGKANALAAVRQAEIKAGIYRHRPADFVEAYPNPAGLSLRLVWTEGDFYALRLIDMAGREMQAVFPAEGTSSYVFDTGRLAAGMYLIELQSKKGSVFKKIAVSH